MNAIAAADLSNVVPFAKRKKMGADNSASNFDIVGAERPAPLALWRQRRLQWAAVIGGSLVFHAGLFAYFMHAPAPAASIGEVVVSAELVVGNNVEAGLEKTPSPTSSASAASLKAEKPGAEKPEAARKESDREKPEQQAEPAPEAKPENVAPQKQAALAVEREIEKPKSREKPVKNTEAPKKHEEAKLTRADREDSRRRAASSEARSASNGYGKGHSDADIDYRVIVRSHLLRHQHNVSSANRGSATIAFRIDAGGRVTSVRLIHGSGDSALDREAQTMPLRASPFPAPPSHTSQTFTVAIKL